MVFGGSGFLGSYVVDELIHRGHAVTVFDVKESPWLKGRGRMIIGDVMDAGLVMEAMTGAEVVYNFAGLADLNQSIDQPVRTIGLNVMGNLAVLEACRVHKVRRFVYASSAYVFSHKGAFYGASKKCSELVVEQYFEQFGLEYTILRYGSVYGERADHTNRLYRILKQALSERRIVFPGDGSEVREYIHGRDAGRLSVDILDGRFANVNIVLTGTERFRYRDLLMLIKEMLDDSVEVEFLAEEYKGHYVLSPYSFRPSVGVKLTSNPCVEFGQGLIECMDHIHRELSPEETQCPAAEESRMERIGSLTGQ
ncbi:MAG: NAD(P)-dependent oxidoreductase [Alphaproteobacteria bacterium]